MWCEAYLLLATDIRGFVLGVREPKAGVTKICISWSAGVGKGVVSPER